MISFCSISRSFDCRGFNYRGVNCRSFDCRGFKCRGAAAWPTRHFHIPPDPKRPPGYPSRYPPGYPRILQNPPESIQGGGSTAPPRYIIEGGGDRRTAWSWPLTARIGLLLVGLLLVRSPPPRFQLPRCQLPQFRLPQFQVAATVSIAAVPSCRGWRRHLAGATKRCAINVPEIPGFLRGLPGGLGERRKYQK